MRKDVNEMERDQQNNKTATVELYTSKEVDRIVALVGKQLTIDTQSNETINI